MELKKERQVNKQQAQQLASLSKKVKKKPSQRVAASKRAGTGPPRKSNLTASGPALSEPTQRCLVVGTAAQSPEAKGAYIPTNVRDSTKYDTVNRVRTVTAIPGGRVLIFCVPCPNADAPSMWVYTENTALAMNSYIMNTSVAGVSVYPNYNDSMYTYASTDYDNAEVRYVGSGLSITDTSAYTSYVGTVTTMVRHGLDPILTNGSTGIGNASYMSDIITTMQDDHRLVHRNWNKTGGSVSVNHLHEGDNQWLPYNRTATQTLASNLASRAYTSCGGGSTRAYLNLGVSHNASDPVMIACFVNTSATTRTFDVKLVSHFERTSDDFARHHTISHDKVGEIQQVFSALRDAHVAHSTDPHTDIAAHAAASLAKRHKGAMSVNSSKMWGNVLKTALKPKNLSMEESVMMAMAA